MKTANHPNDYDRHPNAKMEQGIRCAMQQTTEQNKRAAQALTEFINAPCQTAEIRNNFKIARAMCIEAIVRKDGAEIADAIMDELGM